jgi:hypothetical protein
VSKKVALGKVKGDANCDGIIDIYDRSYWRSEYADASGGTDVVRNNWEADFNCDGKVNIYDLSIWRATYTSSNGGNQ